MKEVTLFQDLALETPPTEGPKYIGSKLKILPHILELAKKVDAKTVFDGFSGTTRVSQAFAQRGYRVLSNDIAVWSKVLGNCYLINSKEPEYYKELIEYLNSLPGKDGWFTQNYGGYPNDGYSRGIDGLKKVWQVHNTRKLDSIREEIDNLNLCETEKSVLLTSLILALDKVDNTIGHFASYLSKWSARSYNTLKLRVPRLIISEQEHKVFQSDIFKVLPKIKVDLAYFDPPYGSNNEKMPPSRVRYLAYYHLWTTICLNDKPVLFGKVNRRKDSSDLTSPSVFEEFRKSNGRFIVVDAIGRLIKKTRAKYIILSYSSGGRATAEELNEVLSNNGKFLNVKEIDYKRNVMGGMRWTEEWIPEAEKPNREFLFLLEK